MCKQKLSLYTNDLSSPELYLLQVWFYKLGVYWPWFSDDMISSHPCPTDTMTDSLDIHRKSWTALLPSPCLIHPCLMTLEKKSLFVYTQTRTPQLKQDGIKWQNQRAVCLLHYWSLHSQHNSLNKSNGTWQYFCYYLLSYGQSFLFTVSCVDLDKSGPSCLSLWYFRFHTSCCKTFQDQLCALKYTVYGSKH